MTHAASSGRRSREGWPETTEPPEWASSVHDHELPPWVRRTLLAVGAFMLLFGVGLGCLTYYVYQDHEYVMGRGQFRDAEAVRVQQQTTEQIRTAMCDLLDGLPAGPLLDPTRTQYDCGPGVPFEQLPPEAQSQVQQFSNGVRLEPTPMIRPVPGETATTPTQPAVPPQEPSGPTAPATGTPASPEPTPGLPPVAPAAPTTAPPLVDVSGLTDQVCRLTGVCA
jgi:hypothetical protein